MGPEYADGKTPSWGPFSAKEIQEFKTRQVMATQEGQEDGIQEDHG